MPCQVAEESLSKILYLTTLSVSNKILEKNFTKFMVCITLFY